MTTTISRAAAMLLVLGLAGTVSAQTPDPLLQAKALYAEAAYEEALNVLGERDGPEAHQYRALCFIALGRTADAERAIERLIHAAPTYEVSDAELPPRLVSLFTQTRQRVMPEVVRTLFADAREDFQAKELQRARGKFEQVLTLLHDPSMRKADDAKDLELLTAGYLDIVRAAPPPAPVPASAPAAPVSGAAPTVAARAAAPRPIVIEPAVTVRQVAPPFTGNAASTSRGLAGSVRVIIGVDGRVKTATIVRSIDPRYDERLLAAARTWQYKPARRDGKAVESEKIVEIQVGR
jgi:TonB family protein